MDESTDSDYDRPEGFWQELVALFRERRGLLLWGAAALLVVGVLVMAAWWLFWVSFGPAIQAASMEAMH